MTGTRHQYRIYIRGSIDEVWNALVDPTFVRRYFHDTAWEEPPVAGRPYRIAGDGGAAAEGIIEVFEPPHRLVQTWRTLFDAAASEEPPSRVEWTLTQAGDGVVQVDLTHGDLFRSPRTWAAVKDGWVWILGAMKTVIETGSALPEVTASSEEVVEDATAEWHRNAGIAANNSIWELLGEPTRTPDQDEDLLRRAYASAYHWARAARRGPVNEVRALYMQSKAWGAVGDHGRALDYADRCLAGCSDHGLADFDLAYAHEARARALAGSGRLDEARAALALARGVVIADDEDRRIVEDDVAAGPWFGLEV